ncbi:polysaccharide pyruvyl transferase family protein [Rhodovulum sp. DZ06]|uniref:polysaccharide pyruvyl transferase family protein n=1 Tax=Rhodovulum sp. DZ06 TaxID=3425126 RepID=UPI003D331361
MLIELHGGQFANRGARKMLEVTVQELSARLPGARFALDACVGTAEERAGFETLLWRRGWMGGRFFRPGLALQIAASAALAPVAARSFGHVPLGRVDALVDLAGFSYTDQWGPRPTEDFARLAEWYRARGKPVILLPQALGPFETPRTRAAFARTAAAADVIYARDGVSLSHARRAAPGAGTLALCPDMTLPVGVERVAAAPDAPLILVPNVRMLDQGGRDEGAYLSLLEAAARAAAAEARPVRIVVHDARGEDRALAAALAGRLADLPGFGADAAAAIVEEADPLALKRILSRAALVVGSRFHALVAALSCGVPCLGIGWSHKYDELMRDLDCAGAMLGPGEGPGEMAARVRAALAPGANAAARARIAAAADRRIAELDRMWADVAARLAAGVGAGAGAGGAAG